MVDFENVTINTFPEGEFDIQTFVEDDEADIVRVDTFFFGAGGKPSVTVDLFPAEDISAQFQADVEV